MKSRNYGTAAHKTPWRQFTVGKHIKNEAPVAWVDVRDQKDINDSLTRKIIGDYCG